MSLQPNNDNVLYLPSATFSEEGKIDHGDISDLANLLVDYAEEAVGPVTYVSDDETDKIILDNPSEAHERDLLISLADVSMRALNTAMIESPAILNLIGKKDEEVIDGVYNALVIDLSSSITHGDLNRSVDRALKFIERSKNRDQDEFDKLSAVDLFRIIYGSMEVLEETARVGSVVLYNGAEDTIYASLEDYDDAKDSLSSRNLALAS